MQDLKTSIEIRERVSVRVGTGEAPRYDAIKADAEVLNAQKLVHSARLRVEQASAMLRNSVGHALAADFTLAPESDLLAELPPLASLQNEALQHNADLARGRSLTMQAIGANCDGQFLNR